VSRPRHRPPDAFLSCSCPRGAAMLILPGKTSNALPRCRAGVPVNAGRRLQLCRGGAYLAWSRICAGGVPAAFHHELPARFSPSNAPSAWNLHTLIYSAACAGTASGGDWPTAGGSLARIRVFDTRAGRACARFCCSPSAEGGGAYGGTGLT